MTRTTTARPAGSGDGSGAGGGAVSVGRTSSRRAPLARAWRPAAGVPLPASALDLLARSDAELVAARLAGASERFVHAHLAALRAGAAVLVVTGRPSGRPVLRTVWQMVATVAPDLEGWTAWFADGAALRAAVESGRATVDDARADRTLAVAEDFQDAVRRLLDVDGAGQGMLALRAS